MDKDQCTPEAIAMTRKIIARFKASPKTLGNESSRRYWEVVLDRQLAGAIAA